MRTKNLGIITNHLINNKGFVKLLEFHRPDKDIDMNCFTCILRIHEAHYLFYSELHKHFEIGYKYSTPKGKAGGGYDEFKRVMLPKVINSTEDADKLLEALI